MSASDDEPVKAKADISDWEEAESLLEGLRYDGAEVDLERYGVDDASGLLNRLEDWVLDQQDVRRELEDMENSKCRYCILENKVLGVDGYGSMDLEITEPMEDYVQEHEVSDFEVRDPSLEKNTWTTQSSTNNVDFERKMVGHFSAYCEEHVEYEFMHFEESWYE